MDANRQYEYVIGIDLGHGETSAAICPLQWDNAPGELDAVKDLEMGGNKKVIPSAITILDDGRAYIGDAAFNPEVSDFIDDAGETGVAVYGPKDETDVYAYAFVVARRAVYVTCERLLVAVEREAYQFTFRVHDRTS